MLYDLRMRFVAAQQEAAGGAPGASRERGCAVRFLGTGTSHGVPMIGCRCDVPLGRPARPAVAAVDPVSSWPTATRLLVDTTPDLRSQALAYDIDRVDAILFTHCHADHVMGLDEVRRFNVLQRRPMPCYGDARTLAELRRTFAYIFEAADEGGGIPKIDLHPVDGPFSIGGETVVPVPVLHGRRADPRLPRAARSRI